MNGTQPLGIYVLAVIVYTAPCYFLWAAWRRAGTNSRFDLPGWRTTSLKAAFFAATLATVLNLIFQFSYLRSGAGIHGSQVSPGIWRLLGPTSWALALASLLVGVAGRGKGKLLLIGWILGMFAAAYIVFAVALD